MRSCLSASCGTSATAATCGLLRPLPTWFHYSTDTFSLTKCAAACLTVSTAMTATCGLRATVADNFGRRTATCRLIRLTQHAACGDLWSNSSHMLTAHRPRWATLGVLFDVHTKARRAISGPIVYYVWRNFKSNLQSSCLSTRPPTQEHNRSCPSNLGYARARWMEHFRGTACL